MLVEPVLAELVATAGLTVISQDDPDFPDSVEKVVADRALDDVIGAITVTTG